MLNADLTKKQNFASKKKLNALRKKKWMRQKQKRIG